MCKEHSYDLPASTAVPRTPRYAVPAASVLVGLSGRWNLGRKQKSRGADAPLVTYERSSVISGWIVQTDEASKRQSKYHLSPDGKRFRTVKVARQYADSLASANESSEATTRTTSITDAATPGLQTAHSVDLAIAERFSEPSAEWDMAVVFSDEVDTAGLQTAHSVDLAIAELFSESSAEWDIAEVFSDKGDAAAADCFRKNPPSTLT